MKGTVVVLAIGSLAGCATLLGIDAVPDPGGAPDASSSSQSDAGKSLDAAAIASDAGGAAGGVCPVPFTGPAGADPVPVLCGVASPTNDSIGRCDNSLELCCLSEARCAQTCARVQPSWQCETSLLCGQQRCCLCAYQLEHG